MEAIIEKLLLIQDEQILNTPLEDLDLPIRVYRGLWRSRIRTVRDVAQTWSHILNVKHIGEGARCEILGALQAWSLSLPDTPNPDKMGPQAEVPDRDFTDLDNAEDQAENQEEVPSCDPPQAVRTPVEALHLSTRTYRALKRNQIDSVDDIYREWDKIASIRAVGSKTMNEIQKALEAPHLSESLGSFADPIGIGQPQPTKNDLADQATADGYGIIHEVLTKKHIISDSGVVVSVDLLQAEEPRKPREERWKNVSPKQQDYAPKNTFQAIGKGENQISRPIRRVKKALDGSVPVATDWLEMSLELLEKARRSRQVRTINCPICMALMLSIRFKKHLVDIHPQAFEELQKAAKGRPGKQKEKSVGTAHTDPLRENPIVKCPLCEHMGRYNVLHIHIRDSHPEIDRRRVMTRFNKANRCKDVKNLSRYQAELNESIKEYERLKQGRDEPRDGSK